MSRQLLQAQLTEVDRSIVGLMRELIVPQGDRFASMHSRVAWIGEQLRHRVVLVTKLTVNQ